MSDMKLSIAKFLKIDAEDLLRELANVMKNTESGNDEKATIAFQKAQVVYAGMLRNFFRAADEFCQKRNDE